MDILYLRNLAMETGIRVTPDCKFEPGTVSWDPGRIGAAIAATRTNPVVADLSKLTNATSINRFLTEQGMPPMNHLDPGAVTGFTSEPLALDPSVIYSYKWRPPSTAKAFKAAVASGAIVLNGMTKVEMEVQDAPIFDHSGSTGINGGTAWLRYPETAVFEPLGPCRLKRWTSPGMINGPCGNTGEAVEYPRRGKAQWRYQKGVQQTSVFRTYGRPDLAAIVGGLNVPPPNNLVNSALAENNSGALDLLTELGEAPETLRYIFGSLRRIVQLFLGLKSREAAARKRFKGKELIDELTSLWMQFRYAASPIAYSIEDVWAKQQATHSYVTTRKRQDVEHEVTYGDVTFKCTIEHRVFVKSRVDLGNVLAHFKVNPAATLWELTPLSFVIDWVLPIGDMLSALGSPAGSIQQETLVSRRIRSGTMVIGGVEVPCDINYYIATNRPLKPKLFTPDVFLSWKRMLDAFALSWSIFLKQHWKS